MTIKCQATCKFCDASSVDLGVDQTMDIHHAVAMEEIMAKAEAHVMMIAADDFLKKALPACKNRHESCAFWAVIGEVSEKGRTTKS
jgi:hypothetical protein